jgi:hypothetical protein
MNRVAFKFSALILGLCIAGAAAAHHPPLMERCYSLTFTGQVEKIEWRNPHVELLIRADSGESHRVTWLNMQHLHLAGIDRDTLHTGDQVTVTVGTRDDVVRRPMLLAAITRTSDGWEWSQTPQGC